MKGNGPKKADKPATYESKAPGICYNFQNHGECKRQNFPYQHVVKRRSENNMRMLLYRGSQPRRGGRGNRGQANMTRGFEKIIVPMMTGSINMIIVIFQIHDLTSLVLENPSLIPNFSTYLLATTAYTPELGKSVGCAQKV
jgi:hypothetical protein